MFGMMLCLVYKSWIPKESTRLLPAILALVALTLSKFLNFGQETGKTLKANRLTNTHTHTHTHLVQIADADAFEAHLLNLSEFIKIYCLNCTP